MPSYISVSNENMFMPPLPLEHELTLEASEKTAMTLVLGSGQEGEFEHVITCLRVGGPESASAAPTKAVRATSLIL